MFDLIKSVVIIVCKYFGVYFDFVNFIVVESKMNIIMKNVFFNFGWGDDFDFVFMVCFCFSVFYFE